jgi:Spy/CpxP family protein refolding chaperone
MLRTVFSIAVLFAAMVLIGSPVASQPPGGKGKDGKGGPGGPGGPPRMELGKGFPPHLIEELNLTNEQQKELEAIEKELKAKLEKLLTAEQKKMVENFRSGGPGGPGGPGGENGGKGGKGGERPPVEKSEK